MTVQGLKSINTVHHGIKYMCDRCDYVGKTGNSLRLHIESDHENIRHSVRRNITFQLKINKVYVATVGVNIKRPLIICCML